VTSVVVVEVKVRFLARGSAREYGGKATVFAIKF